MRAYHYETYRHSSGATRRGGYLGAYNFAKHHLKALRWKTPYETIQAPWQSEPGLFRYSPDHLIPGPNT